MMMIVIPEGRAGNVWAVIAQILGEWITSAAQMITGAVAPPVTVAARDAKITDAMAKAAAQVTETRDVMAALMMKAIMSAMIVAAVAGALGMKKAETICDAPSAQMIGNAASAAVAGAALRVRACVAATS